MQTRVTLSANSIPSTFRDAYARFAQAQEVALLLDSAGVGGETGSGYALGIGAEETICLRGDSLFHNGSEVASSVSPETLWKTLEALTQTDDPTVIWCGALGYELNHWVEPTVSPRSSNLPLGELFLFRPRVWAMGSAITGEIDIFTAAHPEGEKLGAALKDYLQEPQHLDATKGTVLEANLAEFVSKTTPESFNQQVADLLEHIFAGDIYQANLSLRQSLDSVSDDAAWVLYKRLLKQNPSPFSGFLKTPQGHILSNSPERLIAYDAMTERLDTRPIAGTRGRGQTLAEDEQIGEDLQANLKEHAEHLMLLDLMRNDLGRVAEPASVTVPKAFYLERYSHVTHLVSQVTAQKRKNASVWDVLRAVFPGGTITGCPKVRCMQILNTVEQVPRGFYTGSLGYMLPATGHMDWNILIRSLYNWPSLNRLDAHAGAGIVADSIASWEYKECQRKFQAIYGVLSPSPAPVC